MGWTQRGNRQTAAAHDAHILAICLVALMYVLRSATASTCPACLACQTCTPVDGIPTCVDTCLTPTSGLYCDATGGGTCLSVCQASECLQWSVPEQQCVTTCPGCTSCAGGGTCVADESVRSPCGKCPGELGFETCYVVPGDIKTSSCLAVADSTMPLLFRLAKLECNVLDLQRLTRQFDCVFDADCSPPGYLVTCDACSEPFCDIDGFCSTRRVDMMLNPALYMANKCGSCNFHSNNCTLPNPCSIDVCDMGSCVHYLGAPCIVLL